MNDDQLFLLCKSLYTSNINITEYVKKNEIEVDKSKLIEIIYELQTGNYIKYDNDVANSFLRESYCKFYSNILKLYIRNTFCSIIDCGTGELTTLKRVFNNLEHHDNIKIHAIDISLSRLHVGKKNWTQNTLDLPCLLCTDFLNLPFCDNSFDMLITNHALEPNRNNEIRIINEFLRVSPLLILFEPSKKVNSLEGIQRMDSLNFIEEIEDIVSKTNGSIEAIHDVPYEYVANKLNPTRCYVIKRNCHNGNEIKTQFSFPGTNDKLELLGNNFLYSELHSSVFPIFEGIPILKINSSIKFVLP